MVNSQNGWPANPPRRSRLVPGTRTKLVVADGPAGHLLLLFCSDFDRLVEGIDTVAGGVLDDWGWADRDIRGGGTLSNHASATAVDLNALRHPLGVVGTFTPAQRAQIRNLLVRYSGVIRWGGDYSGRRDEMHFEINRPHAAVVTALVRLANKEGEEMATLQEILYEVRRTNDMLFEGGSVPGKTSRGSVMDEVRRTNDMLFEGGSVPGDLDPGTIKAQINRLEEDVTAIRAALAAEGLDK